MAPKRAIKRRQDEDGSPSRKAKRPGKGKKEPTYDTFEEAMDGGVEMEEKGERYGDGDKAQRFYERALDLYKRAYDFEPAYDAAYNQARVLYTLFTSFLLPPTSPSYLTTSIDLYRHAITLTSSSLLHMDAGYNLAEALVEFANVLEDLHGDTRRDEVGRLRNEAREIWERVMSGQEEYIRTNVEGVDVDRVSGEVEVGEVKVEGMVTMDVEDGEGGEGAVEGEKQTTYETHVPTPSALVDTALELVNLHLSIWTSAEPPTTPPDDQAQSAVRAILDRATSLTPVGRQAELDLAEIKVLLAIDEIVWDVYKSEARIETGPEKSLEGAVGALTSLLASLDIHPPDESTLRAEILTILADTHSTIAHRQLFLSSQLPPGPSPLAQGAWHNLSQCVTLLNQALELPTTASTPKTFKPSVLLNLSKASLARVKLGKANETAKRNVQQLMGNATTYANRAAEALGWRMLTTATTSNPTVSMNVPWMAGWDAELLARSVGLQQLRIGHVASTIAGLVEKERWTEGARGLVGRLKGMSSGDGERRLTAIDVYRWIDDVEDEEQGMDEEEKTWWVDVAQEL